MNLARKTVYILYKTGRIDPTLNHIWAFENISDRNIWLTGKSPFTFERNHYWRVGNPIKIPVSYEQSFDYDYVKIVNDLGEENERDWYAFVTARAYVSPNVTMLTLDVDYIQTFYFASGIPFWQYHGFIEKTTAHITPLVGTAGDFPVPQTVTESFAYESGDYAYVMYSTFDPTSVSATSPSYVGARMNGVFSAVCPYVISGTITGATALNNIIESINNAGLTDGIAGIFAIPARFVPSNLLDDAIHPFLSPLQITATVNPVLHSTYEYSDLLDNLDYSYCVVNNGQGETQVFHRWEFSSGVPTFAMSLSLSGGSPTILLAPVGLAYNSADAAQQRSLKITSGISCVYLNDNYKIWLAQTQSTRAAAMDGAQLAISQAEEARSKSWAYTFGGIVERTEEQLRDPVTGLLADVVGSTGEMLGFDMGNTGMSTVGRKFAKADTGISVLDQPVHTYGSSYRELQQGMKMGYDLTTQYLNHQLGIETRYTYDHAVANAQQSLNQLVAGWADKARLPATARGSSTGGDMAALRQYGFMISYFSPAPAVYEELNRMIAASGHSVNVFDELAPDHTVFDFYKANSVQIPVAIGQRPEFVRKMMLDLLQRGVYFWYYNNGDISRYFGAPYGISNPLIDDGGEG